VSPHRRADTCNVALIDLVEAIEARGQHAFVASILVLRGRALAHAAAPHLPAHYTAAVDGIEIGPAAGSCGTAAFCGHPIYVADISTDPLWARWTDITSMALEAGLRACWSMPILWRDKVLGTFAIYHREVRAPTVAERNLIAEAARSAAVLLGGNLAADAWTAGPRFHAQR
jgi:GAF domain-containing protein